MSEQMRTQKKVTPVDTNPSQNGDKSVTGLIKELANDVTSIFTKEVALAKSEISHSMREAKTGAVNMLTGGSVLYAGFLFLLLSAVMGLSRVVELWLASLIVGAVVAIIGFIMVKSGKNKLEPSSFKPEHTINSLKKDRDAVRGATR